MKKTLALVLFILLVFAGHSTAEVIFEDDYDDSVLDPAWSVTLLHALDWTYTESGIIFSDVSTCRIDLSQNVIPV